MKNKNSELVASSLLKRNETVAVAESVTSGLIMASLSLAENATRFFQGGIVAYNLGQKTRQLRVDPIQAENTNCVSEMVSFQMANEVSQKFCSDWGIAITGYAVPVPALKIKTCFALYSFVYKGEQVLTSRIETKLRGQFRVQQYFVDKLLAHFVEYVHKF